MTKENNENKQSGTHISLKSSFFKHAVLYPILIVALVLLGAFIWGYQAKSPNRRVVFTIENKGYSQADVNKLITYPLKFPNANRDKLSRQAYDYLHRQAAARQLNIQPSGAQVRQAALSVFGSRAGSKLHSTPWIELVAYDTALQQNLNSGNLGVYQGYSYIFWFGQHLEKGPSYTVPDFGDKNLITADRTYASSRAHYYYNQLKMRTLSPDKVLSTVQHDPKLGFALPNNRFFSQSVKFGMNPKVGWRNQVFYPDISNYIASQSKAGLSPIRTGKIALGIPHSTNDYVEGYYYVVQLNVAQKPGLSNPGDFTKMVDQVKAQYKGW